MPSIASRTRMVLDRLAFDQARPRPRRRSAFLCSLQHGDRWLVRKVSIS
jgi:hypothetical protein